MRVRNATTGEIVAAEVKKARGWLQRLTGTLRRKDDPNAEALWVDECPVIHTLGMRHRIDVVFLDDEQRVIRTVCSVPQNSLAVGCRGARAVIELAGDTLNHCDVLIGDRLELEP